MAAILQHALLNLAFKDILIPGALSQGQEQNSQCLNKEDSLQLITSLYLLTLTLTNLKARASTGFLYRNLAAKIFSNTDELPQLYKNEDHRQQIE